MLSVDVTRPSIFLAKAIHEHSTLLLAGNFPDLADVIGEMSISSAESMQAVTPFFTALYNQVPITSIGSKIQPLY